MPFLMEQMQFLYFLQQFRNPAVDAIFRFLNFFDTSYFISSLIVFIWIGCSWRWGVRFGYLMIASAWVNAMIKLAFCLPRPFFLDPSLAIVTLRDYGFPSGGAQNSVLLASLLICFWKSRWAWPAGILYCILISFSRIFLGVHFPIDVLGGWIVGALLFILFVISVRPIERLVGRHSIAALSIIEALALAMALLFRDDKTTFLMVSLAAMTVGVATSIKFHLYFVAPQERKKQICLGIFGIGSAVILTLFARVLTTDLFFSRIVQATIPSLWISLLASPFCKIVFLRREKWGR